MYSDCFLSLLYSNNVYTCVYLYTSARLPTFFRVWAVGRMTGLKSTRSFSPLLVGSDTSGMLRGSRGQALCMYVCVGEGMEGGF